MNKISFNELNLSSETLKALNKLEYKEPTQVQQAVIPVLLKKKNVIVKSQTGSGKTASFAIPITETIDYKQEKPQVLILTPTRELAIQIHEVVMNIGRFKHIKAVPVYGRTSFGYQERCLKRKTHVVVATPGRLLDHIRRGTINLSQVNTVIIDEADEMLAMGFVEQISDVLESIDETATKALFSATMPRNIKKLANTHIEEPVVIEIESNNNVQNRIEQQYYNIKSKDKMNLLKKVLYFEQPEKCIVFCNTKIATQKLSEQLDELGLSSKALHGDMEQRKRTQVIKSFKKGEFNCLTATDVASRGLDIDDISLVINYDIPDNPETYVHRIGRTARFEKTGKAISFVNLNDKKRFVPIMSKHPLTNMQGETTEKPSRTRSERSDRFDRSAKKPAASRSKNADTNMNLHINAGKRTKMRARDVISSICAIQNMSSKDIGNINIQDVSTFVEILNGKGNQVLRNLKEMPINGRTRQVTKAGPMRSMHRAAAAM